MIKLSDVSVTYGTNTVYKDFCCTFDEGVNVVLGKSGCGKTTLLNVIADLVKYSGKCEKDGDVSVVFQEPCLAPVSVWKNIQAVLPRGNFDEKIQKALADAYILEKKDCNATKLSGGEQQRVSLARAFVTERSIMLLDEPFSDLDYGVKTQLHKVFDQMLAGRKVTAVLVTHDLDEALALADNIYVLQNKPCTISKVAQIATPRNIRSEYDEETLQLKRQLRELSVL